jgi:hypothetical protein
MADSHRALFVCCGLVFALALAVPTVGPHVLGALPVGSDSPEVLVVDPAGTGSAVPGSVVAYEDLSRDQRGLFDRARAEGSAPVPDGLSTDAFVEHRAVRFEGAVYAVAVAVS